MRASVRRSLVAAAVAAVLGVGPAAVAGAAQPGAPQFGPQGTQGVRGQGHAVFVQSDSPSGNQIIVLDEHQDGRLSERQTVATGGLGGQASSAAVDQLASQDSLTYDPSLRLLFAVNAGSDSLSVLSAQGRQLRLLQVVGSGGTFPDSVAVSGNLVYVLNAGGSGTLTGYRIVGDQLVPLPRSSRSLGLDNTTPPNSSRPRARSASLRTVPSYSLRRRPAPAHSTSSASTPTASSRPHPR